MDGGYSSYSHSQNHGPENHKKAGLEGNLKILYSQKL